MTNINTKILLVTHKPCELPNCDLLVPIHAGRAVAMEKNKDGAITDEDFAWLIENSIGDNTGDNISDKNRYYCECSALYWAWKNYEQLGNPDYIGLIHYRRHFIFNENYFMEKLKTESERCKAFSVIEEPFINGNYLDRIGFNTPNIQNAISGYDAILSYPSKMSKCYAIEKSSVRNDYASNIPQVDVKDFDLMVDILKRRYPDSSDEIDKFINCDNKYGFQMFIMKKELFFEYCKFLFEVLFEIENKVDFRFYGINGKRSLGYLAEIMLTLFFIIKDPHKQLKKRELGISFIEYPETNDILKQKLNESRYSYFRYLKYKFRYLFTLNKKEKERLKQKYKQVKKQIKFAKSYRKELKDN